MTYPSNAAVDYLYGLYLAAPDQYPDDEQLDQALQNSEWKQVVTRLIEIRDSESIQERLAHFSHMMSCHKPTCVAGKILRQAVDVYTQARDEQDLITSL